MKAVIISIAAAFLLLPSSGFSQAGDTARSVNKKRLNTLIISSGVAYSAALIGLNELWYADTEKQAFTFFNDGAEWKQVDKLGHVYSAFYLSYGASRTLQWCSLEKKKADLWGSVTGFLLLVPIEIFDGFSEGYGASGWDLVANLTGAGFYLTQSVVWNEVRIHPKFSFRQTEYPGLRTDDLLGDGFSEIFKDYNGQTYWLSFDLDKFIRFPKWLNLAVGYGADEMVYSRDEENAAAGYNAYRQFYLGVDFDLSHIKTKSKALNTFLFFVNMIKLPAPAIEFSEKGTTFRAFQF
jgi:hypothetical protein